MDQKSIMLTRRRLNELASSHNKLTTLVACLLNEINALKREIADNNGSNSGSMRSSSHPPQPPVNNASGSSGTRNPNKFPTNFNELRAEEILRQLTVNSSDN